MNNYTSQYEESDFIELHERLHLYISNVTLDAELWNKVAGKAINALNRPVPVTPRLVPVLSTIEF